MTRDDILAKYAAVPLRFKNYYKFSFTFEGVCAEDGATVSAWLGGNPNDIYREDISADKVRYLGLEPMDEWTGYRIILNGDTAFFEEHYLWTTAMTPYRPSWGASSAAGMGRS